MVGSVLCVFFGARVGEAVKLKRRRVVAVVVKWKKTARDNQTTEQSRMRSTMSRLDTLHRQAVGLICSHSL